MPESLITDINRSFGYDIVRFNVRDADKKRVYYYFGNTPDQGFLDSLPNLEWVHFGSVGIDKLDERFIEKKKLTVTNGAKTNTKAVITYCMGEIFRSCKAGFLPRSGDDRVQLNREYFNNFYRHMRDFDDISVCVLGYGDIGKGLVDILSPIVRRINVVTRTKRVNYRNVKFFQLESTAVAVEDVTHVVNVLPLHKDTETKVDSVTLRSCEEAYYICAGRAETHCLNDVIGALKSGRLRGASIDVYGLKGGRVHESLMDVKNVHLTPHISGWTNRFWTNQSKLILNNIKQAQAGKYSEMRNLIYCGGVRVK